MDHLKLIGAVGVGVACVQVRLKCFQSQVDINTGVTVTLHHSDRFVL